MCIRDRVCCGEKMKELLPNTVEASGEKHLPVAEHSGSTLTVTVGAVEHLSLIHIWKWLLKSGSEGVATSDYGRNLMREMMLTYDGNQKRYAQIAGHGFRRCV